MRRLDSRLLRSVLAAAVLAALASFAAAAPLAPTAPAMRLPDPATMATYQFGILSRGPTWTPGRTPHGDSVQAAHLANIGFMHQRGLLVAAGPFMNDGTKRGIFIFKDVPQETLAAYLAGDPAIASQRLVMDLHRWYGPRGVGDAYNERAKLRPDHRDSMIVLPLVFLKRPAKAPPADSLTAAKLTAAHLGHTLDMLMDGRLLAAGPFFGDGEYRGVSIFGTDTTTALRLSLEDPAVKAGRMEVEMIPWFTAWGNMPPQPVVREAGK
jgi:uncharacterized protein YciI